MAGPDENSVHLIGRVTGTGEPRHLPSGDVVHLMRVTVPRPPRRSQAKGLVDAIDVACWSAATRRTAGRVAVGDRVEVTGALRRRFFRGTVGVASRYEVEASALRRIPAVTAPPPGGTTSSDS